MKDPSSPAEDKTRHSIDSFQDELEEYDLLGSEDSPGHFDSGVLKTDLSTTARAFNTRIQRKKKLQEEALGEAERAARLRHTIMLKALVNIRKSLKEVIRIDLGDRFHFIFNADDWNGWPRLSVRLVDQNSPLTEYQLFSVTAHDRNDAGTIELAYDEELPLEKLSLAKESDLQRLPKALKKCVRTYLDRVGDIVLAAETAQDDAPGDDYIEKKDISDFAEKEHHQKKSAISANFFEEDYTNKDFLDMLPSLDEVESLPELHHLSPKKN